MNVSIAASTAAAVKAAYIIHLAVEKIGAVFFLSLVVITVKHKNLHGTCHLLIGLYALSCFLSKFFYDMQTFLGLSDLSVPLWVCAVTQWPFIYGTANIYPMMLVIAVDRMLSVFAPIWYATRNDKFYLPFVYFLSALIPILILEEIAENVVKSPIRPSKCLSVADDPFINPTIVTFVGLSGVLINILVIVCYAMMAVKIFYFRRENSSHHKSILKTLMIIMGIQVCGWITTFLASLFLGRYQHVIDYGMLHILYNAVSCLASLSSTVEVPALYFTSTEHRIAFRKEYMAIVGKFTNRNGTNSVTSIKVVPARNMRNANLSN